MTAHATALVERPLSALDAIYTRRSVRSYRPHHLAQSTIRALLDAAVQAPTAMNEQPWLFAVVQDRQILERLSARVKAAWIDDGLPESGRHRAAGAELHAELTKRLADPAFDVFYGAGALVVICARRTDAFVEADCWLAAENLMLAATALGLGTCCIGAAVSTLNTPQAKALIALPPDVHAVVPIVIGVPAGSMDPVARREPEIVSWT